MQLFVRTLNGRTYTVETDPDDTVGEFKEKLFQKSSIPVFAQKLIFRGVELKQNYLTLSECYIEKEMRLHLIYLKQDQCNIEVKLNFNGNKSNIEMIAYFGTLIEDIKFKIQDQSGYSWDEILIICNGREIGDSESIIIKHIIIYLKLS